MKKSACQILFISLLLTIFVAACGAATAQPTKSQPVMTVSATPSASTTPLIRNTSLPLEITDNGVKMVLIPAGTFRMGNDNHMFNRRGLDQQPGHDVNLPDFYMDVYEVTNAHYEACVTATRCQPPQSKDYGDPKYDDYPVVYIDWNMAKTYCEWRGPLTKNGITRLPSEAEWEKAARGTDERHYPWGNDNTADGTKDDYGRKLTVVGAYEGGKSPYGVYDMAGNVWEWTADWYDVYPGGDATINGDFGQKYRVVRGGDWNSGNIGSDYRNWHDPSKPDASIGFRCARSIAGARLLSPAPTRTVTTTITRRPTDIPTLTPVPTLTPAPTATIARTIINDKRGAKMVLIPAGTFIMGSDKGPANEKPIHMVDLPDFYMDLHIVSNGRYRVCVLAGKCLPPTNFSSYGDPDYYRNPHYDDSAVLYVNWDMAKVYCEWRGARLPTEAELEKAERGLHGDTYIWGEGTGPTDKHNFQSSLGLYEMAGSGWQWASDWYGNYDPQSDTPVFNPQGPPTGEYRVLRGGYFLGTRTSERNIANPAFSNFDIGFRCARSSP